MAAPLVLVALVVAVMAGTQVRPHRALLTLAEAEVAEIIHPLLTAATAALVS